MYKALVSFCGAVSMHEGEVRELYDMDTVNDLLKAGYIEKVKPPKVKKKRGAEDGSDEG